MPFHSAQTQSPTLTRRGVLAAGLTLAAVGVAPHFAAAQDATPTSPP